MATLINKVIAFGMWLRLVVPLYKYWSLFWCWIERLCFSKHMVPVPPAESLAELSLRMKEAAALWTPDSWWHFFDAMTSPERLAFALSYYQVTDKKGLPPDARRDIDCDEFARYCAVALRDAKLVSYSGICVLEVVWQRPDKPWWHRSGHHVCLFQSDNAYYHIGNWGLRGPFFSVKDACMSIVGLEGTLIAAWTIDAFSLSTLEALKKGPSSPWSISAVGEIGDSK